MGAWVGCGASDGRRAPAGRCVPNWLAETSAYGAAAATVVVEDEDDEDEVVAAAAAPLALLLLVERRVSSAAFCAARISLSWIARASAASLIAAKALRCSWMKASSLPPPNMAAA